MAKKVVALFFILFLWTQAASAQGLSVKKLETALWPKVSLTLDFPTREETKERWFLSLPNDQEFPATSLTTVSSPDDDRYSVLIVLDTSKSLTLNNLNAAKDSLSRLAALLDRDDQLALIAFNDTVQIPFGFSTQRGEFSQALRALQLSGSKTEFYQALRTGFDLLKNIPGRRTMVVVSDGQDDGTGYSSVDVLNSATGNNIRILAIYLSQQNRDPGPRLFMEKLASETNGRFWAVEGPESLSMAVYDVMKDKSSLPIPPVKLDINFELTGYEALAKEIDANLIRRVDDQVITQPLKLKVPENLVKVPEPEPETEPGSEPGKSPEAGKTPESKPGSEENWLVAKYRANPALVVATGVSALIFIVILILFLKRKKRLKETTPTLVVRNTTRGDREVGQTVRLPATQTSPFILEFMEFNQRYPLKFGHTTLGANKSNDIVIDVATVSGRHAEFHVTELGCQIKDLNSTNGTLVNDTVIRQFTTLKIGDILKFGTARAMLIRK
ncbi:MAG: VWA domain-containing protein [Deltaproteobacteria bacterium]|jgi:Mg-chelatase subunit ChlD|nr:VWA domain-containing protein [Deltaproteobacteria bacterium]